MVRLLRRRPLRWLTSCRYFLPCLLSSLTQRLACGLRLRRDTLLWRVEEVLGLNDPRVWKLLLRVAGQFTVGCHYFSLTLIIIYDDQVITPITFLLLLFKCLFRIKNLEVVQITLRQAFLGTQHDKFPKHFAHVSRRVTPHLLREIPSVNLRMVFDVRAFRFLLGKLLHLNRRRGNVMVL